MKRINKNIKKSFALFSVLGVIGVLVIIAISYNAYSSSKRRLAHAMIKSTVLNSILDSALNIGFETLKKDFENTEANQKKNILNQVLSGQLDGSFAGKINTEVNKYLQALCNKSDIGNGRKFFTAKNLKLIDGITKVSFDKDSIKKFKPKNDPGLHGTDPKEQYGTIILTLTIKYDKLSQTKKATREFKFVNLTPPIVSKFTLFVADFNLTKGQYNCVNIPQNVTKGWNSAYKPLIIFNTNSEDNYKEFEGVYNKEIKDYLKRGWIYLWANKKIKLKRAYGADKNSHYLFSQIHQGNSLWAPRYSLPRADSELNPPWKKGFSYTQNKHKYFLMSYHFGYFDKIFTQRRYGDIFPVYKKKLYKEDGKSSFLHLFGCPADRSITRVIGPVYDQYLVLRGIFLDHASYAGVQNSILCMLPYLKKKFKPTGPKRKNGIYELEELPMDKWNRGWRKNKYPDWEIDPGFVTKYNNIDWDKSYKIIQSQPKILHYNDVYAYVWRLDEGRKGGKITIDFDKRDTIEGEAKNPGKSDVKISLPDNSMKLVYKPAQLTKLAGKNSLLAEGLQNKATYVIGDEKTAQQEFEKYFLDPKKKELSLKNSIIYIRNKKPLTIPDGWKVNKDQSGILVVENDLEIGSPASMMEKLITFMSVKGNIKVKGGAPIDSVANNLINANASLSGRPPTFRRRRFAGLNRFKMSLIALGPKPGGTIQVQGSLYNLGNIAVRRLENNHIKGGGMLQYATKELDPTIADYSNRYFVKISDFNE
ncbi:hypothetical protein ACFL35_08955 [Candidatus Riflebacteria bacterium]